jgi:cyclophilin family peptidyl-prolyl cis-trans isomerase
MKRTVLTLAGILLTLTGTSTLFGQDAASGADSPAVPAAAQATEPATPPATEAAKPAEPAAKPAEPADAAATEAAKPAAEPAAKPAEPATPAPVPGEKAEAFEKLFAQWKQILSELRDLKYVEYPEAGVARQVEIRKRWDELIAEGEALKGELLSAAAEAFKEAPGQDQAVTQFLANMVVWDCQQDDYEKAFDLAQVLIDHGIKFPNLTGFAGEAAFCTNRFDLAEKYFNEAIREGAELSKEAQAHQQQIGYYKVQWANEDKIREAEAAADDLPRVEITTEHGKMIVELFENEAPNTVANFISLVKKGFYDGLTFHRVLPNFMAQGGCPEGTGGGGPGYRIECECVKPNSRKHFRGSLSMAHAGPDTGGSQFFLCFVPAIGLDGPPSPSHHTVFGRVIEGLDVLAKIKRRDPEAESPGPAEKIISMKVLRDRGHEYQPETLPELK